MRKIKQKEILNTLLTIINLTLQAQILFLCIQVFILQIRFCINSSKFFRGLKGNTIFFGQTQIKKRTLFLAFVTHF